MGAMTGLPDGFIIDQPDTSTPNAPPSGFSVDQLSSIVPEAISDVPRQALETTVETAKSGASDIASAFPGPNRYAGQSFLGGVGSEIADIPVRAAKFYRGLATLAGVPVAPLVGAVQSLVGHPLASAEHWIGTQIAPETAAKDDPQAMYNQAKNDVAESLSAARPAGVGPAGTLPGVTRQTVTAPAAIPTVEELKAAAKSGYNHPEVAAVQIEPDAVVAGAANIKSDLIGRGLRERVAPNTFAALDDLKNQPTAPGTPPPPTTIADIESVRQNLGQIALDYGAPRDAYAATHAIRGLDDFMVNLQQPDLVAGDAAKANQILTDARANRAAAYRAEAVDRALENAELNAGSSHSGMNMDNATRQQLKTILKNRGVKSSNPLLAGYDPDEVDALHTAVVGKPVGNTLRFIGNYLGAGGGWGALASGAAASYATGSPLGFGLPAVGMAAKLAGAASTARNAAKLNELLRQRSPLYQSRVAVAPTNPVSPSLVGADIANTASDIQRAKGGAVKFNPESIGAKKAKDGHYYLSDPKRAGKFLRVVHA